MTTIIDFDGDEYPGCCEYAEWEDCNCDEADDYDGTRSCFRCGGAGEYVPDHCCLCGGSPYCNRCHKCGANCVADCNCPIPVMLESGKTITV